MIAKGVVFFFLFFSADAVRLILWGHVVLMWQQVYGMLGYAQFQTDGLHLWL